MRLLRAPLTYVLTVILGGAVAAWAVPKATAFLDGATEALGDPIRVMSVFREGGPRGWVFPDAVGLDEVGWSAAAPKGSGPDPGWAVDRGAAEFRESVITVVLRGERSKQVTILDVVPVLKGGRCGEPMTGTLIPKAPAGAMDKIWLSSELDAAPVPEFLFDDPNDDEPAVPFGEAPTFFLAKGEELAVNFRVLAGSRLCEWRALIVYTTDGRRGELELGPPDGGWWAVSGAARPADYAGVIATFQYCMNAPVELDPERFFAAMDAEDTTSSLAELCPQWRPGG